jgi:hypothetical protein
MHWSNENINFNLLPRELKIEVAQVIASFEKKKKNRKKQLSEREFGFAKGKVTLSDDFNDPIQEFEG